MKRVEVIMAIGFVSALTLCNLHLIAPFNQLLLHFDMQETLRGEWWRVITHPFVHISWYHLLLDAAATAILWKELESVEPIRRLFTFFFSALSSLLAAVCFSQDIHRYGLCGLSGTAHGLMIFLGLHFIVQARHGKYKNRRTMHAVGLAITIICLLKSVVEITTGQVIFASMHAGALGIPIVESHLGGTAGGILAFLMISVTGDSASDRSLEREPAAAQDLASSQKSARNSIHAQNTIY